MLFRSERAVPNVQWKIPSFETADKECRFSISIANSEYDHNMHVNNTRYADYCFNVFSLEELKSSALRSFAISYVKQCYEGDALSFYRMEVEPGRFLVQGHNQHGEIVIQAEICFQ